MGTVNRITVGLDASCDWRGCSWRNMATDNCSGDMDLLDLLSLKKMKKTSPSELEVWTENLRKALWQSNPKMIIRKHTPESSDKTETRFFFPNTPNKTLNP
jgi:hypothetical protein